MTKLTFSGHESFVCKQFWLKKGYDFIQSDRSFTDEQAVVDLGVGKNMVRSIKFWLSAFGITADNTASGTSELGDRLFGKAGLDPYLEAISSVWLLHYNLVKNNRASIYNIVFNEFRNIKEEFRVDQLHNYLKQVIESENPKKYNPNTIERDIRVFVNNYIQPKRKSTSVEESYSGLLYEINILGHQQKESITDEKKQDYYDVRVDEKDNLDSEILLFAILDTYEGQSSVAFRDILIGENSPGRIFALSSEGLYNKIQEISQNNKTINFSETAGNRQLQFNSNLDKWQLLHEYYNK